jgi:hypothetical protein
MRLTISFVLLSTVAFAQHGSGALQVIADKASAQSKHIDVETTKFCTDGFVDCVPYPQSGPVAQAVQPDTDEVSCHVQEVKLATGKTSQWQPWIRISQKDGRVWSQKRRLLPRQVDALHECQAFVELASYMRGVNEAQAKHTQEMSGEYESFMKTVADLEMQNDQLQKSLASYKNTLSELQGRIEALEMHPNAPIVAKPTKKR